MDCELPISQDKIRHLLLSVPVLKAPDFAKQFKLMVDASDVGSRAVLLQEGDNGIDHPVWSLNTFRQS